MPDTSRVPPPLLCVRMLTDGQLEEIHQASLTILEKIGVKVDNEMALDLLRQAGCQVGDDRRAKISGEVVERALESAPSRVDLFSRQGHRCLELSGRHTYFGTGSDLSHNVDLVTSDRRASVLADTKVYAKLCDCLENLDFVASMSWPTDVPVQAADQHRFLAMIENTVKPVVTTVKNRASMDDLVRMAESVAGGSEALVTRPFVLAYLGTVSPLELTEPFVEPLLKLADLGLPFVFATSANSSASRGVPPSLRLATANAEFLSGLAIAQLRSPGAPVIMGTQSASSSSSPELMHHRLGTIELARHRYDLPVWGGSVRSDSKLPDIQAGIDSTLWILWTALSGANLVCDLGTIESGLAGSSEMVVVGEEIIGFVRRLLRGMETSEASVMSKLIETVRHDGEFLAAADASVNPQGEWQPTLFDRHSHEGWIRAGRPNMIRTAREVAIEAIGKHVPEALPEALLVELRKIVIRADQRVAEDS